MAPTKTDAEKGTKLTPEQSAALILDYLRKQNRPYSATDVSTNLKNRVTKAAATKLLKDMHERKEIEGRSAGKQIVYHAIQEEADEAGLEELREMEAETTRLREATNTMKAEEKELRQAVREGASQVSLPELRCCVANLEQEKAEMTSRLVKLKSGNVQPVQMEERDKVNADHRKWERTAHARKKIRNELWAVIKDQIGGDKAEDVKEELGLEL